MWNITFAIESNMSINDPLSWEHIQPEFSLGSAPNGVDNLKRPRRSLEIDS